MPAARLDSGPAAATPPKPASAASALATASSGLFVLAAMVVIAAGIKTVSNIIGPSFLVLTLVITVHPLRTILVRRRVPSWLASIVVLLSVYGLLILVLGSTVWSLTRLVNVLPEYADEFTNLFNSALDQLSRIGIETTDLRRAIEGFNLSSFTGVASQILSGITSGLSVLLLVLAMVVFITFDAAGFGERLLQCGQRRHPNADSAAVHRRRRRHHINGRVSVPDHLGVYPGPPRCAAGRAGHAPGEVAAGRSCRPRAMDGGAAQLDARLRRSRAPGDRRAERSCARAGSSPLTDQSTVPERGRFPAGPPLRPAYGGGPRLSEQ